MKLRSIFRWTVWGGVLALWFGSVSCTTTYDAYGRPVQTVDPGVAVAGAAAAGVVGYSIARDQNRDRYHHHYRHSHHGNSYYYSRYNRRIYR
jgi:hypothetical protein